MNTTNQSERGGAVEGARRQELQLSPSDLAFNAALDKIEAFVDRWIVTPLLGPGGNASDY